MHSGIDYGFLAVAASRIRVTVIGGGRAGFIKAKRFLQEGSKVTAVSKEYSEVFKTLESYENLTMVCDEYDKKYITTSHLVVAACDDEVVNLRILADCEEENKLYICCQDSRLGNVVMPYEASTENIQFAMRTTASSPKTTMYLASKAKQELSKYDSFVEYAGRLRREIKNSSFREELLEFINSEDFYAFFSKGYADKVIKLFYGGNEDGA